MTIKWVIDIEHWLNETQDGPAVPRLKLKVNKMKEVIIYATSVLANLKPESAPKCWKRPKHKPCTGEMDAWVCDADEIQWECSVCGDAGIVKGWTGLIWDMLDVENDTTH